MNDEPAGKQLTDPPLFAAGQSPERQMELAARLREWQRMSRGRRDAVLHGPGKPP